MISHLPGIGPSAGIALLIPITFGMDPTSALIMLSGIYYGCMYGGAVTAILLNTPGDAAAVMTTLDGYPMARQGRAGAALAIAAVSSFVAGTLGVTALTFVARPVAEFALQFGPAEYFALMVFALSTASALNGDSLAKGLIATFFGLAISTVGLDLQSGRPRFTFGMVELQQGISFLVVVVGVFALAEAGRMVEGTVAGTMHAVRVKGRIWFTREDWRRAFPAILRGWGVGFFCGSAPGLGGTVAAMLSYVLEKRISRTPEQFGHGAIEGVAGPEAAVNADATGAFVHLLALGIPASGSTAVIMGAFIMFGLQPGPLLFTTQPDVVWGLIASMYVANVMLLVLNLPLVALFARVLYAPPAVLLVLVLCVASVGVYSFQTDTFMLYTALIFGIVGFGFGKLGIPRAPFLFGVILGSKIEQSFRQAMTLSSGDAMVFLQSPLAASLLALAVATLAFSFWSNRKSSAVLQRALAQQAPASASPIFPQPIVGKPVPIKPGE
jgi:putative tricarboxylic transport membrane protein